jgi:plasmid maintenance system killer protein
MKRLDAIQANPRVEDIPWLRERIEELREANSALIRKLDMVHSMSTNSELSAPPWRSLRSRREGEMGRTDVGYYYLHTNGDLIFRRTYPDLGSDFVRRIWPLYPDNRGSAWGICVEALALGAREGRIKELQDKWQLFNEDAVDFADYCGLKISMDGDQWCATLDDFTNLQESPAGFGDDALHAFAELLKQFAADGVRIDLSHRARKIANAAAKKTP